MALKKWWEVYPQGTKEGDEECKFFAALARHPEYKWRSVDGLADETKIPKSRIEEIIGKYAQEGLIYQNTKDPDQWGYWERIGEKKVEKDIIEEENNNRLFKKKP